MSRAILCGLLTLTTGAFASEDPGRQFERGWYLETHEGDLESATAAYERVTANPDTPDALRREATTRLAQLREDLATSDLARIMPPDALAYVEIRQPGIHIARVAGLLGLDVEASPAAEPAGRGIPLGEGFFLPREVTLSPALIAAIKEFRGVAAALTSFDERTGPHGIIAVHPGNSDVVRGLLETAVQVLEPAEAIGGCRTYRVHDEVWIVQTARLFIVARSRDEAAAAVARLNDPQQPSLAGSADFQRYAAERTDALLFAWVDGPRIVERLEPELLSGEEGRMARAVLDLDQLQTLTATVGTTDAGVQAQIRLELAEGHRNLAYALVRTAALSRRSIGCVPAGAAAVALLGLNPPGEQPAAAAGERGPLSAMEIGREVFANVEELALFVLPSASGAAVDHAIVPDLGLIIVAKDPARSESLWNQLLTLPALLGLPQVPPAAEIEIHGRAAREYRFPELPPVVVVQLGEQGVVLGTRTAVAAAVAACDGQDRLADDPAFRRLLDQLPPNTAKALLADAARVLEVAGNLSDGRDAEELKMVGSLVAPLRFMAATDEAPASFAVRLRVDGLPDVSRILRTLSENEGDLLRSRRSRTPAAALATPASERATHPPERLDGFQPADVNQQGSSRSDE